MAVLVTDLSIQKMVSKLLLGYYFSVESICCFNSTELEISISLQLCGSITLVLSVIYLKHIDWDIADYSSNRIFRTNLVVFMVYLEYDFCFLLI